MIAGLTQDALIAPWFIKGAMDGSAFAICIREVLFPEITPGTVVILDILATHRNKEAAQALRHHGCWFLYLPLYSHDLNPIEQAFSKLKAHLRKIGARTFADIFQAIGAIRAPYDRTAPPEPQAEVYARTHQTNGVALLENVASHDPAQHGSLNRNHPKTRNVGFRHRLLRTRQVSELLQAAGYVAD